MYRDLNERFNALEGQPVRVYTDDGRAAAGIILAANEQGVRLIARHGGIIWIQNAHIASVEEPRMRLCCLSAENDEKKRP